MGNHLNALGWTRALSFAPGDPAALPASLAEGTVSDKINKFPGLGVPVAWKELPASLQSGLKQGLDDPEFRNYDGANAAKVEGMLGPDTPVYVDLNMKFAVSVPGYGVMPLMLGNEYRVPQSEQHGGPFGGSQKPKPIHLTEKTRGILCAPSRPTTSRQVVDRLPAMGFNALFCDVFTGGRTFFPNTALPPTSEASASVLAAAIAEGRAKSVIVYAVMDTLCWRAEGSDEQPPSLPPGFTEDLTLGGKRFRKTFSGGAGGQPGRTRRRRNSKSLSAGSAPPPRRRWPCCPPWLRHWRRRRGWQAWCSRTQPRRAIWAGATPGIVTHPNWAI